MIQTTETATNMGGQSQRMHVGHHEKLSSRGGGNGLEKLGARLTVEETMIGLEEIRNRQTHVREIVCSILRQSAAREEYKQTRYKVNRLLREAIKGKENN